jgi:hypothetical protein
MKKYIRTMQFLTWQDKETMRKYLNDLGFYCLSFGNTYLEVYVIEDKVNIFDKWLTKLTGGY